MTVHGDFPEEDREKFIKIRERIEISGHDCYPFFEVHEGDDGYVVVKIFRDITSSEAISATTLPENYADGKEFIDVDDAKRFAFQAATTYNDLLDDDDESDEEPTSKQTSLKTMSDFGAPGQSTLGDLN